MKQPVAKKPDKNSPPTEWTRVRGSDDSPRQLWNSSTGSYAVTKDADGYKVFTRVGTRLSPLEQPSLAYQDEDTAMRAAIAHWKTQQKDREKPSPKADGAGPETTVENGNIPGDRERPAGQPKPLKSKPSATAKAK